jgi:UDP-sugar transporter A1/2/3
MPTPRPSQAKEAVSDGEPTSEVSPLTEFEQSGLDPRAPSSTANASVQVLKWGSLVLLVMQNSSLFVVTRYTRAGNHRGHLYLPSVVVLIVELLKMAICLGLILFGTGSVNGMASELRRHVWEARSETLRLGVPAACYALQNNLIFVAISNLSATAAQVLFQLKTISTACFTILLLGKSFRGPQWLSFILLTAGVVLVQSEDAKSSAAAKANPFLGVCAALVAATLSGFAGVYLEKMFTSGSTSLWMRNVQLGLFSLPQAAALVVADWPTIAAQGPLVGFSALVWNVVLLKALGGLLVAAVVKYADNVLKTYATAIAIVLTFAVGCVQTRTMPTIAFLQGLAMVIASIFLYNFSGKAKPGAFGFLQASAADVVQQGAADIVQGAADILQGAADALQEAADALQPTEEGAEEAHNRSRLGRMLARLRAIRARGVRNPDKDP